VGGYRDYFTDDQVAEIEGLIQKHLSQVFGYSDVSGLARAASA
jgi:hypothetical protein